MIEYDGKIGDLIFHPALYVQDIERIKESVKKFLTEGGDINQEDERGRTIFGVVKFSNHKNVEDILGFLRTKNSNERIGKYYESLQATPNTTISTPTKSPSILRRNSTTSLSSQDSSYDALCTIL